MKQKAKNIILLILILILAIEFFIYYSDFNLVTDRTLEIGITTLLITVVFIFFYFTELNFKIIVGLPTIIIGIVFLFFEFFGVFGAIEKTSWKWEIGEYEIIYANLEFYAGPGGEPYMKLRKKYFYDQIYKTYDKQKTENTFLELGLGKEHCNFKFKKTGIEFDLCEKKQLK
jgi:hypothetical protein